jgi:beta-phosphoglucomutase
MVGIIFDCDGTLVDSETSHFLSWQKSIEMRGSSLSKEEYYLLAGNTGLFVANILHEKVKVDSPEAILRDKTKFYQQMHQQGIPPIDRTVQFVRELIALSLVGGIKLAVASAAPKDEILANLSHVGIIDGFDAIVSGVDDLSEYSDPEGVNKPKPYIYLHAAKRLGLAPSQCVAFEDSRAGVLAATRAGLLTYAVPNTITFTQDFTEADFVIDSSTDIDKEKFFKTVRERIEKKKAVIA